MGDRPGSSFRVRTIEDKVCRKDLYWSVRIVYALDKLPDVSRDKVCRKDMCWSVRAVCALVKLLDVSGSGLGEAGRYS